MNRRTLVARTIALALVALVATSGLAGCGKPQAPTKILVASTTSFRDTEFDSVLLPAFTAETGIDVDLLARGTGEALAIAERGDADVVVVHARKAEDAFMAKGAGVERRDIWWNRFLIAGPADDPAGIRAATGATSALERIGAANAKFMSRGDDSGTHKKEKDLWGALPKGSAYQETGQGQGPTLTIASEKRAYVLTDEGTLLKMQSKLALVPLFAADPALRNPYGAIVVKEGARGRARFAAAKRFVEWLTSAKAKALVQSFTVDGRRAFFLPDETPPADR